jgi:hypothetical protein
MKDVNQETLATWCSYYSNCYYYLFDGTLYNTGDWPEVCEDLSDEVSNSKVFEEVTKDAEKYHPQLEYEVEHNDCRLFRIVSSRVDAEIIICYFGDNYE